MIHHGDCLEVMAAMEPESVDAVVTDPPYGLVEPRSGSDRVSGRCFAPRTEEIKALRRGGFMGKKWDGTGIAFRPETWAAALRVAKPSAYLLAFGGTRTVHRMTSAIEDAGWIIRDMLVWAYASGFPKSKASLKPAWEPIVMARKPGPLRMLAVDACRVPISPDDQAQAERKNAYWDRDNFGPDTFSSGVTERGAVSLAQGRWPANVILTDPIFDGDVAGVVGGGEAAGGTNISTRRSHVPSGTWAGSVDYEESGYGDSGTYSRFFLLPKADRVDREPIAYRPDLEPATPASAARATRGSAVGAEKVRRGPGRTNTHPTVKPTELMRHLVRLVTPAGGTVLDPFLGSGTTGLAAELEGFPWIGIEREAEYVAIAEARLNGAQRGLGLPA